MSKSGPSGYVLNRTRRQYLATRLAVADTHWLRFCGLMGKPQNEFGDGNGLWITPCRGVHTWGMRFPIDVAYLDPDQVVVHVETGMRPWRFAPIRFQAASVLELPEHTLEATGTTIGDELEIHSNQSGDQQTL
jgi:uncharacterized protein